MTADGTQISPQGLQALDESALLRLLALAGPADAFELMRRLDADLRHVAVGLTAGLAKGDMAVLREHSHVLMAVAGTIGANHIHHLAQDLNRSAKENGVEVAEPFVTQLLHLLDGLVERLQGIALEQGLGI